MRRTDLERLLPAVFQLALHQAGEGEGAAPLLGGLLEAMAALHTGIEQQVDALARTFDPRVCPERFVPLLSHWLSLPAESAVGMGRQRELLARAVQLGRERGTHHALRALLVCATGLPIAIDEGVDAAGALRAFHLVVRAPADAAPHVALLHALIAGQKPAYVTYELCVSPGGEP